jgi:type I restriction enzyme S subunit
MKDESPASQNSHAARRGSAGEHRGAAMKKGWQAKNLGDVCSFLNRGVSPKYVEKGGIAVLNQRCVRDHRVSFEVGRRHDLKAKSVSNERLLQAGDVLVNSTGTGTLGRVAQLRDNPPEPTTVDSHVTIVRPSPEQFFPEFFGYMLRDIEDELKESGEGCGGQTELNRSVLAEKFVVRFPQSLAEQQRIVGLLDEAFAGIATAQANAEKNLQNARELFESHLQSVFTQRGKGWVEKTLEICCDQIFAGGDVPKDRLSQERTPKYSVPIFSNGEKDDGLYGFTDVARVTKPSITVSARGTLGFTAIRTEPFLPVVRLIVLVPDEKQIMLPFLYYAVVGMDFGNTGTSIPQLTVPNFKESKLHVPSITEQNTIVEKLDALREETQCLASLYERKLAALDALKKSLLHQAFTGEL